MINKGTKGQHKITSTENPFQAGISGAGDGMSTPQFNTQET